jgi:hypothetical protein
MSKDEYGVMHENIIYSYEEDKLFCLPNAPDKETVGQHHQKQEFHAIGLLK